MPAPRRLARPVDRPHYHLGEPLLLEGDALFWLEREVSSGACTLASVSTFGGASRFRVPVPCVGMNLEAMLAPGLVIVGNRQSHLVSAYDTRSGILRWASNVHAAILDLQRPPAISETELVLGVVEAQQVIYLVRVLPFATWPPPQAWLVGLDLGTGALRWTRAIGSDSAYGVVGDGQGRFAVRGPGADFSVFDSSGPLWSSSDQWQQFAAGRVFGLRGVHDSISGAPLWTLPPAHLGFTFANERVALASGEAAYRLFDATTGAPLPHRRDARAIDVAEGAFAPMVWPQALLEDDSVLYSDSRSPDLSLAEVLQADGGLAYACALPSTPYGSMVVGPGRAFLWTRPHVPNVDTPVTLHAVVLPGARPGTGWWQWRGGSGADGRPH
ncbi:MAG: hypothetical protein AB1938_11075 [Myxococcota bacterium]